jgi:hypothetical protein
MLFAFLNLYEGIRHRVAWGLQVFYNFFIPAKRHIVRSLKKYAFLTAIARKLGSNARPEAALSGWPYPGGF